MYEICTHNCRMRIRKTLSSAFTCVGSVLYFQGVYFPTFYDLWARWAPAEERTKLINLMLVGEKISFFTSIHQLKDSAHQFFACSSVYRKA